MIGVLADLRRNPFNLPLVFVPVQGAAHIPAATPALLTKVEKLYAGK